MHGAHVDLPLAGFSLKACDRSVLWCLADLGQKNVGHVHDAVQGRHHFMAQACCQLLREIVLHFHLLALHDFRDVVQHENLLVLPLYHDPSYFDFDCFCRFVHFS